MSPSESPDADQDKLIATLKTYYKLAKLKTHRDILLKDAAFVGMFTTLLGDPRAPVVAIVVKILLSLTESKEDACNLVSAVPGLSAVVLSASERETLPPALLANLMVVASRLASSKRNVPSSTSTTTTRRFVTKITSRQVVFEMPQFTQEELCEVERGLLHKKGVISVYMDSSRNRIVIRCTDKVNTQDLAYVLFDIGCEMVTQIVTVDGQQENFNFYATEREKRSTIVLPEYIDDMGPCDPDCAVVTNEFAQSKGWLSSVASLVKFW